LFFWGFSFFTFFFFYFFLFLLRSFFFFFCFSAPFFASVLRALFFYRAFFLTRWFLKKNKKLKTLKKINKKGNGVGRTCCFGHRPVHRWVRVRCVRVRA
jgi:hypothetical protein